MERAQWGYSIKDALNAQIPDIYTTKEMQKEKANWKHKLMQARKEVLVFFGFGPFFFSSFAPLNFPYLIHLIKKGAARTRRSQEKKER
jgi:hypothetical protein